MAGSPRALSAAPNAVPKLVSSSPSDQPWCTPRAMCSARAVGGSLTSTGGGGVSQ